MDLTPSGLAPGPAILSIPECREHLGRAPMSLPWVSNARWQTRLGSEPVTRRVFSVRQDLVDHRYIFGGYQLAAVLIPISRAVFPRTLTVSLNLFSQCSIYRSLLQAVSNVISFAVMIGFAMVYHLQRDQDSTLPRTAQVVLT